MFRVSSCDGYTPNVYQPSIRSADNYPHGAIGAREALIDTAWMQEVSKIRKAKGLSQTELAEACGVKQATISRIENGTNKPSYELLEGIAAALSVTIVELIGLPEMERMVLQRYREASPQRRAALLAILETD